MLKDQGQGKRDWSAGEFYLSRRRQGGEEGRKEGSIISRGHFPSLSPLPSTLLLLVSLHSYLSLIVVDTAGGPHAEDLISPVSLGMRTKNPKVVAICISSMQRLVALHTVSEVRPCLLDLRSGVIIETLPRMLILALLLFLQAQIPSFIQDLQSVINQGVDIQLKILQAVLVILTIGPVNGFLLGDVSRLYLIRHLVCSKMKESGN